MLAITRDDQVGPRGHGGSDDMIIIGIVGHDARNVSPCESVPGLKYWTFDYALAVMMRSASAGVTMGMRSKVFRSSRSRSPEAMRSI